MSQRDLERMIAWERSRLLVVLERSGAVGQEARGLYSESHVGKLELDGLR